MTVLFRGIEDNAGLTASLCALSVLGSLKGIEKTVVLQHKSAGNDLRNMLIPLSRSRRVDEASNYYVLEGMDYLLWNCESGSLSKASIDEVLVPVVERKLYYLPSGERLTPDLYPEKTAKSELSVLEELTKMTDNVFIDCGTADDAFTKTVAKNADLIINVLSQKEDSLNSFFISNNRNDKRNIYLVSNYDRKSVLNIRNLTRIYRIPSDRICAISENPGYYTALSRGGVKDFIEKNLNRALNIRNEVFMADLKNAYEIMNRAVIVNADIRDGDFGLCGAYKESYKRNLKRKFV